MGEFWIRAVAAAAIAYFCGCFNGAVIVSKYILRDDVRTHGSGNAGLTNFYRTFGGPLTFGVILTDVLKAIVALVVGGWLLVGHLPAGLPGPQEAYSDYWAGLFCLLGHMFPCMFQFKGGKGILSGGAIALMMDWRIALVVWGVFILFFALTRMVSVGSLTAGLAFMVMSAVVYRSVLITCFAVVIGCWCSGATGAISSGFSRGRRTPSTCTTNHLIRRSRNESLCTGQRRLGHRPVPGAAGKRPRRGPLVLYPGGV